MINVLHDWDAIDVPKRWALKRGVSLLSYALSGKYPILLRLKYFNENAKRVEAEKLAYMETLIKLDELCGVTPIFGIRQYIRETHGKAIDELAIKYEVDIRQHIHIGELPDPNRKRLWVPPLTQSETTWHFDKNYARGERVVLKDDELAIWHVDRPHLLPLYIAYLHETIVEG